MKPLPANSSDQDLIAYIDCWTALLEKEDYNGAFGFTAQEPSSSWTPKLIRSAIKGYGKALESQHVTVHGMPTDISQRKEVNRWPKNKRKQIGAIDYDLNIDGFASDLTAIFWIIENDGGLSLELHDIHVL